MTTTAQGERAFVEVLEQLVVTSDADGEVFVGPCDDPAGDLVSAFLVDFLAANPSALRSLVARLGRRPCDGEGVRRLPLTEVLDVLELIARRGATA